MIKLYKQIEGRLHYHEAWTSDSTVTQHWGVVGEEGNTRESAIAAKTDDSVAVKEVLKSAYAKGYTEVDVDDHATLVIEFSIDGFGSPKDLDKRHRLQSLMDETLGWTGLGHCDGGSIGSGTMEVACLVVDFDTAKSVVESKLKDTEFGDYTRIYDESD